MKQNLERDLGNSTDIVFSWVVCIKLSKQRILYAFTGQSREKSKPAESCCDLNLVVHLGHRG